MAMVKSGRPCKHRTPQSGINSWQTQQNSQASPGSMKRIEKAADISTPEVTIGMILGETKHRGGATTRIASDYTRGNNPVTNQGNNSVWAKFDISKLRNARHRLEVIQPHIEGIMTYTKIVEDDIDPEVKYWESVVACYVLGASPLLSVLTGFSKRIWNELLIDRIIMLKNGVVLAQFDYKETRDRAL